MFQYIIHSEVNREMLNTQKSVCDTYTLPPEYMDKMMSAASKDKSFIERTMKCAEDFIYSDSELQCERIPVICQNQQCKKG